MGTAYLKEALSRMAAEAKDSKLGFYGVTGTSLDDKPSNFWHQLEALMRSCEVAAVAAVADEAGQDSMPRAEPHPVVSEEEMLKSLRVISEITDAVWEAIKHYEVNSDTGEPMDDVDRRFLGHRIKTASMALESAFNWLT